MELGKVIGTVVASVKYKGLEIDKIAGSSAERRRWK